MKIRIFLLVFFCLINPIIPSAQDTPICADDNPVRNCCGVTDIADCPAKGCGGDPQLNTKKNRKSKPAAADVESMTLLEIANFKSPKSWVSGTKRTLLATWGEGKAVQLTAYLMKVGGYKDGKESTNCHLSTIEFNDFHLVLVKSPTAAKKAWKLMETNKEKGEKALKRAERKSLTAEITPRIRPAGWDLEKLEGLAEKVTYVRVTGWAMLDTMHIKNKLNRLSNWEIHPVTKFEVCTTTVAECDQDSGWDNLENVP